LIILKIGGSVITDRRQERPVPLRDRLDRISREISQSFQTLSIRLILIHGAGSFGHPIVKRSGIDRGLSRPDHRLAMGETQRLQNWLNAFFVRHLLRAGLPAFPCQASACSVTDRGRLLSMDFRALAGLLEQGLVPVLFGVPSFDAKQGCSILSGDVLAIRLFQHFAASSVLHGTNVRGVFTADPSQNPDAKFLPTLDLRRGDDLPEGIGGSSMVDVTGGLRNKLEKLQSVRASGRIFDATVPGNVLGALSGEPVGTRVIC
jgi:isopentenyl phosphate kinase